MTDSDSPKYVKFREALLKKGTDIKSIKQDGIYRFNDLLEPILGKLAVDEHPEHSDNIHAQHFDHSDHGQILAPVDEF